MKSIYIAGKITGDPNYRAKFARAGEGLTSAHYIVLNPAFLPEGLPWESYMHICIPMLQVADAVYMLKDWKDSKGAKAEHEEAKRLGKLIMYQPEVG